MNNTANLQIGGEMILLAQSGSGQWQQLGATADPVDGRNELNLLLAEAADNLSAIYRQQAYEASKLILNNQYLTSPIRHLGDLAISKHALGIMKHIASPKDLPGLLVAEKSINGKMETIFGMFSEKDNAKSNIIPASTKELYEHILRKYTLKWRIVSDGILAWANNSCGSGMLVLNMLYGLEVNTVILGCASDLSALARRGAVRRETLGRLVVGCKNGTGTTINVQPTIIQELIKSFRNLFFSKTGRPAGINHGGSEKMPVIDLGYFPKERADMLTCTEGPGDNMPVVEDLSLVFDNSMPLEWTELGDDAVGENAREL